MIITDEHEHGVCFVCGRELHPTHVVLSGYGEPIKTHLRCLLKMAYRNIRKVNGYIKQTSEAA